MERIKQKLHSRRGASIILAMLLMMVAVMVSAVIISASYTAAKRVNDDSDRQQGLLTASSAARFVAEDLRGVEFSKKPHSITFIILTRMIKEIPTTSRSRLEHRLSLGRLRVMTVPEDCLIPL